MSGLKAKSANKENEEISNLDNDENNLSDEIQKLNKLLNDGILTQEEFEKAKKILLSNGWVQESAIPRNQTAKIAVKEKAVGPTYSLQVAVLSTVALVFSAISVAMNPSPLSFIAFSLFGIASMLNWIEFFRGSKGK